MKPNRTYGTTNRLLIFEINEEMGKFDIYPDHKMLKFGT
jgi:hypothetical protein